MAETSKFKVGDRVRLLEDINGVPAGTETTVAGLCDDGAAVVHKHGWVNAGIGAERYWYVLAVLLEPVVSPPKFKVGDRVRLRVRSYAIPAGTETTVAKTSAWNSNDPGFVVVDFEHGWVADDIGPGRYYHVRVDNLEPVPGPYDDVTPGDLVVFIDPAGEYSWMGLVPGDVVFVSGKTSQGGVFVRTREYVLGAPCNTPGVFEKIGATGVTTQVMGVGDRVRCLKSSQPRFFGDGAEGVILRLRGDDSDIISCVKFDTGEFDPGCEGIWYICDDDVFQKVGNAAVVVETEASAGASFEATASAVVAAKTILKLAATLVIPHGNPIDREQGWAFNRGIISAITEVAAATTL